MLEENETLDDIKTRVFGQIWVAQSLFHVFPSDEKLLEFILQTLKIFPDIKDCGMCVRGAINPVYNGAAEECSACAEFKKLSGEKFEPLCHLSKKTDIWVVPLDTADRRYGYVQVVPGNQEYFENFKSLFLNFFNAVAITLENRWQRKLLEKTNEELRQHASYLDHLVSERTAELRIKNVQLEGELAQRKLMEEELKRHRNHLEELVRQRTGQLESFHERLIHAEKLAALGKLTGSIAHEFNNPIYGLVNILEQTLEEGRFSQEIKELLQLGVKECDRMANLIRKLRDFYKPPSELVRTQLDIHQVIDDMISLTNRQFKSRNILLEKNYALELPRVTAVEDQMKQVVLNLLQNAGDAIGQSGGKITISTEVCGGAIRVAIQDTGEGIPEKSMKLIFEPFFSTRAIKGTGLGLSVCHGIVKSHGGEIHVQSKVGEGSTFTFTLPINNC